MTYEAAPATKMLAVDCACCRKELLDAKSVELGMGPVCRKKHGFDKADGEANWQGVVSALLCGLKLGVDTAGIEALVGQAANGDADARAVLEDALLERVPEAKIESLLARSARELCNALVHRIACEGLNVNVAAHIKTIGELGYTKLAGILTKRAAAIVITRTETGIEVRTPYSEAFNVAVRRIPSRRWVKETKGGFNKFAAGDADLVRMALEEAFAGQTAAGPKGLFKIAA